MSLTQLQQLINDDISHYQQLERLLTEEREALKLCKADPLQALLQQKTTLLTTVRQNATRRSQIMAGMQFEANEAGFSRLLGCLTDTRQVQELRQGWDQLQSLLQQCQEHNTANAMILQRTQQTVKRFLNIYRGQDHNATSLYNRSGNLAGRQGQYCLAQA